MSEIGYSSVISKTERYLFKADYSKLEKVENICKNLKRWNIIHDFYMDVFMPIWIIDANFNYIIGVKKYFNNMGIYCEYGAYPFELRVHCFYYSRDIEIKKHLEKEAYNEMLPIYKHWLNE